MFNPGAAGSYDFLSINAGGRMQWAGLDGAPKTSYVYFSAPADKVKGAWMKRTYGKIRRGNKRVKHPRVRRGKFTQAFGGQLLADSYGPFTTFKFAGTYAVHLPINRDYSFSFGTNVGLSSRAFIPEKAQVLSVMTGTGSFDATYANFAGGGAQYTLDVDAGLYFYGDEVFAGFSMNNLTNDLVKFGNKNPNFDPGIHYFFTAGYEFQPNRNWGITPAILVKYIKPAPVSVEATLLFDYNQRFWYGVSYRHKDAVIGMVGATLSNSFRIGYSFDLSTSRMIKYTAGGHELVLSLMLGRDKRRSFR